MTGLVFPGPSDQDYLDKCLDDVARAQGENCVGNRGSQLLAPHPSSRFHTCPRNVSQDEYAMFLNVISGVEAALTSRFRVARRLMGGADSSTKV